MKTLALAVLTLIMVGCSTTHGRGDYRAKGQRVGQQHHDVNRQYHSSGDRPDMKRGDRPERERYMKEGRRLRQAVEEGKLTKEEAKEKFESFCKKGDKPRNKK